MSANSCWEMGNEGASYHQMRYLICVQITYSNSYYLYFLRPSTVSANSSSEMGSEGTATNVMRYFFFFLHISTVIIFPFAELLQLRRLITAIHLISPAF